MGYGNTVTHFNLKRIIDITNLKQNNMNKSIVLLKRGFESSSGLTPEFAKFFKTFKSEFTKELKSIGATDIIFSRGHFYLSGFFTINEQAWYFSLSDVRGGYSIGNLLYRTAKDYKDYGGGGNQYVKIESGMANSINLKR
jgi:hypothetical protein